MRRKGFIIAGIVAGMAFAAFAAVDQARIDAVARGELKEAKASWWGFDPQDSTKFLQAAIHSKVPKLIIDKQASPWITKALFGVSNQTIVFEDGAEIRAKKGDFKNVGYGSQLLRWDDAENVKVIGLGKGGILRMHKKDYQNPDLYKKSEYRHALHFVNSKNIHVENMTFASSGGDGIYLTGVENVRIRKVVCDDNHRQGMSIIWGKNILVEDSAFINTSGTSPQSGVDIEPNRSEECVKNIVFRNCRFADNARWGLLIAVAHINCAVAGDIGIRCENCVFENNREGEYYLFLRSIFHTDYPVTGRIELIDCIARNNIDCKYLRPAVEFSCDLHHQVNIVAKNLTVARGRNREKAMRIAFHYPNKANAKPQAKIKLDNVKFTDCSVRDALEIMDNGLTGATDYISGSIVDRDGRRHGVNAALLKRAGVKKAPEFDCDYSDREATVAGPADGKMEPYPEFPLYEDATWWLRVGKGQEAKFTLKYFPKVRRAAKTDVMLTSPDGKRRKIGELAPDETKTFTFTAPGEGFCRIDMKTSDLRVALTESNVPAGIILHDFTHRVIRNAGTLFFNVPQGAEKFAIRVWGQIFSNQYYAVKAAICDPNGKIVFSDNAIGGAVQYTADRSPVPGVWKIVLEWPKGGQYKLGEYNLRFMGVSPYVGLREDRTPVLGKRRARRR